MTTAPTTSDAERLARGLEEGFCGYAAWLQPAAAELRRQQDENKRLQAAERTLQRLGYQDHGGQEWAPPIGQAPDFDLIDSLRARIAELDGLNTQLCEQADVAANAYRALEVKLVAEALATAEHKLRADQLAQQHRMQAQMHAQATQQLAELEARKPLPPARADELMAEAGYLGAPAESRADFINGLRHAEAAHGITGGSS